MNTRLGRWLRLLAGLAILGVVLWRAGSGPFLDGVRSVDLGTLVLGALIGVPVTVACAWRWHLVARGLGLGVGLGPAVAYCYRSQFLNSTLPGGVLGDVHRGVHHGRGAGDGGLGLRSVVWERFAGQMVQIVITAVVLLLLPSPVRSSAPGLVGCLVLLVVIVVALTRTASSGNPSPLIRVAAAAREDMRRGLLNRPALPAIVLASTVAVAGHVSTYLLAARAVGVTVPPTRLVPLALVVLLAMAVPLNVAGWGPREGVAAWVFSAAGLGATQGVASAVAYGVIATVANLPGVVVLLIALRPKHVDAEVASTKVMPVVANGGPGRG